MGGREYVWVEETCIQLQAAASPHMLELFLQLSASSCQSLLCRLCPFVLAKFQLHKGKKLTVKMHGWLVPLLGENLKPYIYIYVPSEDVNCVPCAFALSMLSQSQSVCVCVSVNIC